MIIIESGKEICGIIGFKFLYVFLLEECKKLVDIKNMYIDIGVCNKEEVKEVGIELGNMIIFYSEFELLVNDKYLIVKVFDNCYGCVFVVEVF